MIWRFERGDEVLRLETRIDSDTQAFVLVITWTDRPEVTERYWNVAAYEARLRALENELAHEHWCQVGSPVLLHDGWKGPIPH